jgi:hypothetical protein
MTYSVMSSVVSDQQATPVAKVNTIKKGGVKRSAYGFVTAVVATTAGQTNALLRIPARARITDLRAENATMGNGAFDLDLYRIDGTAVTSAGALLADFPLTAHSVEARVDLGLSEANGAKDINTLFATQIGTAGSTGDAEYDIVGVVITVSTGTAVAMAVEIEYVLPE